jgi:hypothetical protein
MKRTLVIAAIIGMFMATSVDLQAHQRRRGLPEFVRAGIAIALIGQTLAHDHHRGYDRYQYRQDRHIAREIRRNEKRIWKLEKKMNRHHRYRVDYRYIRELEQEIRWLEQRNYHLRRQLY